MPAIAPPRQSALVYGSPAAAADGLASAPNASNRPPTPGEIR